MLARLIASFRHSATEGPAAACPAGEPNRPINFISTLCCALAFLALASSAHAQVEVDITEGSLRPMPIALPVFSATDDKVAPIAASITEVVIDDLTGSGLFRLVDSAAFIQKAVHIDARPHFPDWRAINAQSLVVGRLHQTANGRIRAEFRLWDVFAGKQLLGEQFFTGKESWRRLAHIIADAIYSRLTGERGYFDTRIVFVEEQGPKDRRIKRLAVMDQDGANLEYLTSGTELVLTPRFSPTNLEITYMSYENARPRVYLLDLETRQREVVGDFPGMTFAPRFSPDGHKIIMSLQQGGNANLYEMDLRTRVTRRLTNTPAIDTAPSYSPDGSKIVFESDRSGTQQLYVMNRDGSMQNRISRGEGSYSTPVWSPRGDLIAFTKKVQGRFLIGVMRPDGSGERIITEGYHNEGPSWAPNGRVLIFFRENPGPQGGPKLYTIDLTGRNERQVATPYFASDPAWSPLIGQREGIRRR